jgi:hypothetical protein
MATNKAVLARRRRLELGGVWFELVIKKGGRGGSGDGGREFNPRPLAPAPPETKVYLHANISVAAPIQLAGRS